MVEFGLIATVLFMLSLGLVDVGRAFYQYNAIASAARYAARWGAVVGGTCNGTTRGAVAPSTGNDWCNQESGSPPAVTSDVTPVGVSGFWTYDGNWPKQSANGTCPTDYTTTFADYYIVGNYAGANNTSIIGAIARRFDTNSGGSYDAGARTPGFNLNKMYACIQLPWDTSGQLSTTGMWRPFPGDRVQVFVYYPFHPVTPLLAKFDFNLVASSSYVIQ